MNTSIRIKKFRAALPEWEDSPTSVGGAETSGASADDIAAIRAEGLTTRQLRTARRVALRRGFEPSSDYDAVRVLREHGIDPFHHESLLDVVAPTEQRTRQSGMKVMKAALAETPVPAASDQSFHERNAQEVRRIQAEIASRRRRRLLLLATRLSFFVLLPTFLVGWYFATIATPMYATNSEIVIQQAQPQSAQTGFSSLFQGTSMATQQDSIAVQSYLASREAMLRLDTDHGFKAHFSDPAIDDIQRLSAGASNEAAFDLYQKHVRISYDPTEGLIRMEVTAADPQKSYDFSQALISYAEEQVDQLTARLRADQMRGAEQSYRDAEQRRAEALAEWLAVQEAARQIDPNRETSSRMSQINELESQRQRLELVLQARLNVDRPSEVQVQSLRDQIASIDGLIASLRDELAGGDGEGPSLAARNTELRTAEENYNFQTIMVQQALSQMETARIEANRQVRYLSQSVRPVVPDAAAYPRTLENTVLAFLIFAGIYLFVSLTAAVLREQISA